jgi:electron transport complex protein RnfD
MVSEFLFNLACKKEQTLNDLSAAVTGLILALSLPANVELWQCVIGAVFAIVIVKCVFGGLGCNFANPAATARIMLFLAFSASIGGGLATRFVNPDVTASFVNPELVASATPLEIIKMGGEKELSEIFKELPSLLDMLIGNRAGAIGEGCALAVIIGGVYLIVRRVIRWHTPAVCIATVFVLSFLIKGDVTVALYETLGGGLLFASFFMITDYVTTPINKIGKMVFALGCGILTVLFRFWGSYPEGISFAILIMNILTPYIEKLCEYKPLGKVGKKNEVK